MTETQTTYTAGHVTTPTRTLTVEDVFTRMTPYTIAAFIADLDGQFGDLDNATLALMRMAIDALGGLVGKAEAISILSEYDVNASNPMVAAWIDGDEE